MGSESLKKHAFTHLRMLSIVKLLYLHKQMFKKIKFIYNLF